MSEDDPTASELLTEINVAISDLITGKFQSQAIAGRSYTKLQLPELREMRQQLRMEVRPTGGRVRLGDIS